MIVARISPAKVHKWGYITHRGERIPLRSILSWRPMPDVAIEVTGENVGLNFFHVNATIGITVDTTIQV